MASHPQNCQCHSHSSSTQQSLTELDFERGIWNAAIFNEKARIRDFIANGKTMERDNCDYTALHYAARSGNEEICKMLIKLGSADVNAVTKGGATALHRAAMMGHLKIVELLISCNANVFLQDEDGETALHRAASRGHMEVSKYLLEHNAELRLIKDTKGQIPFDLLSVNSNDDFKNLLKI